MKITRICGIRLDGKNLLAMKTEEIWIFVELTQLSLYLYMKGSHGLVAEYMNQEVKKLEKI